MWTLKDVEAALWDGSRALEQFDAFIFLWSSSSNEKELEH